MVPIQGDVELPMLGTSTTEDVNKWFLMDRPNVVLTIVVSYFLFVVKVGPVLMKNRKPFELGRLVVIYNFLQILLSAFLVYKCLKAGFPVLSLFSRSCPSTSVSRAENVLLLHTAIWWYTMSKITELLDSVFFVLRKSDRQLTFLHIIHHGSMVLITWTYAKYGVDYHGPFSAMINSMVHVMMYAYYMLAAMGPEYKKYLCWKKYMTVAQLIQFCVVTAYVIIFSLNNCETNMFGSLILIGTNLFFLLLFIDFYRKSYTPKKNVKQEQ